MFFKKILPLLSCVFFIAPLFAAPGNKYIDLSVGGSFASLNNSVPQISYSSGALVTDSYPLNSTETSASIFSIRSGYEFKGEKERPAIAIGLGFYSNLADMNFSGQVTENIPGSDPYNYAYAINSTRLMAEIQLTWMLGKWVPFINIGLGPAWNRMDNYTETAVGSGSYPPLPPFQPQTNVNLAYQAGLGLSMLFHVQERISLGYRYVNLGSNSFGTRGADYPYALNTGVLTANEVYLSYTYLF
jgi:opacity protein-like surface antigen